MRLKSLFSISMIAVSTTVFTPLEAWELRPYENRPQPKPYAPSELYDWQSAQQHKDLMLQMQLDRWQREREQTSRDMAEQQDSYERELRRQRRQFHNYLLED